MTLHRFLLLHVSPSYYLSSTLNSTPNRQRVKKNYAQPCHDFFWQSPGTAKVSLLHGLVPERGLVTMRTVLLHNVDVVDFPNGNLAYFLLTIFAASHNNHLTHKKTMPYN